MRTPLGAIATFAYEKRAPLVETLVDTNVSHVLLRMFAPVLSPKTAVGQRLAWALADATLPKRGQPAAWEHNQALMELGALVSGARDVRNVVTANFLLASFLRQVESPSYWLDIQSR